MNLYTRVALSDSTLGDKGLPACLEAEVATLGAFIIDSGRASEQTMSLSAEMFSLDSHRIIFRAIQWLAEQGREVDYLTLVDALDRRGDLERVGDRPYIMSLNENQTLGFSLIECVRVIREKWRLRELMRVGMFYSRAAAEQMENSDDLLGRMQSEIFTVMQDAVSIEDPHVSSYSDLVLEQILDDSVSPMGFSYGNSALDAATMGMRPGENTVVGGRSGVGKTVLLLQAAAASCRQGIPVDLFSLEMSKGEVLRRLFAMESRVMFRKLLKKQTNESDKLYLREAAASIKTWPLRIHDDGDMTLSQIASRARLSARKNGMRWFGVDYAQIVNADGKDDRTRVAGVSRALTKLAKKEKVAVMLLSQLAKVSHENYSKPPSVRDLRETGQLENDAHAIVLIHRGWNEETAKVDLDGEFIMPKLRSEEPGAIRTRFNGLTLTFDTVAGAA